MYQHFIATGFLGQDPTTKDLPSGQKLATFTVASSRRYKDKEGNRKSETEWHPCVAFGRLAEIAGDYLRKGKKVLIEGRLQTRSYEKDINGTSVKFFRTEIILSNFTMLDARPKDDTTDDTLPTPEELWPEIDPETQQ